ncbi:arsenate reductase (glutaredoxin) [Francisellaceae bacterium]|nr:arsenate reductase (glutaredoxin) [Francisellaceae bacterium]
MNTLYHNPRCSKSRETLAYLQTTDINFEVIEYLKNPPSTEMLLEIGKKLQLPISKIIRTKEALFKELALSINDQKSDQAWAEILAANPKLIERPIFVTEKSAAIGRPLENIISLIKV